MEGTEFLASEGVGRPPSCVSRTPPAGRRRCGAAALAARPLKPSNRAPTPPRRRTRQGLDEDLHGACSARGSTTVCTAAPARCGRAAVGAGGGGEGAGRGAPASTRLQTEPPNRGRGTRGWLPRDAAAAAGSAAAAAATGRTARCARGGHVRRHADRRSHRWPTPQDYGGDTGAPFARGPRPQPPPPTRPDRRAARDDPPRPRSASRVDCRSVRVGRP